MSTAAAPAHGVPAIHRDYQGAKIGMWIFLFTEIILFGGLFILYSAYRAKYPQDFHNGGQHLDFRIGVGNTFILLTSSLTIALSITALQKGKKGLCLLLMAVTILMGAAFLGNKYVEWSHEIHEGIYPNSPELLQHPPGEILFYGLYFTMTGLHGLHVIAGMLFLAIVLGLVAGGRVRPDDHILLENGGLYWHLVDVIWIFLLPLFYLAA